jgi:hypothetical protein
MTSSDDDEVWKDIVERLTDSPVEPAQPVHPAEPAAPVESAGPGPDVWNPEPWNPVPWEDEGRFVPPVPPKVPMPEPPRLIAWAGLISGPLLLLIFVLFSWRMPSWASTILIVWFVGGFGYLIATMKSGPRDPNDDGAVV